MTYITSIGLDVHARSVSACAFDPFTGEVAQRRFGTDAGEIAEWILGFESPKAVYESGPTGFALCRELRALGVDCVVGAVSKMQKPSAEKRRKNDRRDAAFLARLLATRNITEVWVPPVEAEAARDLSRALDDAQRGPAARPPAALQVPAGARARVRRDRRARAQARRLDEGVLEVGGVLQAVRPGRGGRLRPLRRLRALRRVRQARPGEEGARRGPRRPVEGRGRGALAHQGHRRRHGVLPGHRGEVLLQVPHRRRLRLLARPRALRALERREGGQRRHHQDRELRLQARPRRGGVALQVVLAEAQGAAGRLGRAGGREAALRRRRRAPPPEARIPRGGRQAALRRQRRGRPRARLLGLGGRQARRGDARVAPRGPHSLPAGRARASTHRRDRLTTLFMGSPRAAPDYRDSKVFRNDGPGRRIEMR